MKLLGIIILIGCLLSPNLANAEKSLPCDLIAYMNSLDINYEPVNKSDLSEEAFDLYTYKHLKPEAQIINDFDGDSRDDYALVVNNRGTFVSVVVFLKREDSYTHRVIMDMYYGENHDKNDIKMVMIPVAESAKGIEGTLEIKHGGVYVQCAFCPSGSIYYWDKDEFAAFLMSD